MEKKELFCLAIQSLALLAGSALEGVVSEPKPGTRTAAEVRDEAWDMTPDKGKFGGILCDVDWVGGKLTVTPQGKGVCRVDWRSRPGVKPSPKVKAVEVEVDPPFQGSVLVHFKNVHTPERVVREAPAASPRTHVEANLPLTNLYQVAGVEFNLIVNENDGEGRDGWIQLAPGLGDDFSTDAWALLMFQ